MSYKRKYFKYKNKYLNLKSLNTNMNPTKCQNYLVKIGSFVQESDKMFASDPSYDYVPKEHEENSKLMKLNCVIKNVLPGIWFIYLIIRANYKDRNAELICIHESYDNKLTDKWTKICSIGVDSGNAGIYDLKYFRDDNNVPNSLVIPENNILSQGDKWLEMNYDVTSKPTDYAGAIPNGAVSSSGFGDGIYPVYILENENSKIVGAKIIFIDN